MLNIKQRDLKVGDKIGIATRGYNCATVTRITDGIIHLVRPYIHFDNETGIDYIGVENWSMFQDSDRTVELRETL